MNGIFQPFTAHSYKNGTGIIHRKYPVSGKNLKTGGNPGERIMWGLTRAARQKIRASGMMLQHYIENTPGEMSANMYTLTYRRNVPDDKTAKKHLRQLCKRLQRLKKWLLFVWVAQYQQGTVDAAGNKSYRAENGAAIHFHVLTTYTDVALIRRHWLEIVHKWEKKQGFEPSIMSGVNASQPIYKAHWYITRYIKNGADVIKGNNYGISKELRKLIVKEKRIVYLSNIDFISFCQSYKREKIVENYDKNKLKVKILEPEELILIGKDFATNSFIYADDVVKILHEIGKIERNRKRINKIKNNKKEKVLILHN